MKYITQNSLRSETKPTVGLDRAGASLFVLR
jgi:hypothetical protein